MKILFGMYLDGAAWSNQTASIGEIRTGPLGLLSLLETRLILSGPTVHPVHRIDANMKRMEQIDNESAWFHASFSIDSWSTARQMLEWRDELIEAGWNGDFNIFGSARLNALSEIEKVGIEMHPGRSDRLRSVIKCLENKAPANISVIQLMEPFTMLPPVWRYLLELLQSQGTIVQIPEQLYDSDSETNLGQSQRIMKGSRDSASFNSQDDSLALLKADNEWDAADQIALWLSSEPEMNERITIICGSDTSILDQALKRHGMPCLGRSEPSRWREIQQILPLMLGNAWNPIDINLLVELLSLTMSPIPNWVCRHLLRAVAEEPGVGGRAWNSAMEKVKEKRQEDLLKDGDPEAEAKAQKMVEEIQALLVSERYDAKLGIPEDKLRMRCQKVIEWLGWRVDADPMLAEVIGQARDMQRLSYGKGIIPRITLERMLDTVIGAGSYSGDVYEEASPWRVVDHPEQVVDKCDVLIWWGFNDPTIKAPTYWSDQERIALEAADVHIEKSGDFRSREAYAWQQGFMLAEKRFIGVHISQIDGEDAYHHPFWDTICYTAVNADQSHTKQEVLSCFLFDSGSIHCYEEWGFAGRKQPMLKTDKLEPAGLKPIYAIPSQLISGPATLSYSQMNTLIGCPMKWALQYHARLRLSDSQTVPTGNQMIGTFCHRIVEELYSKAGTQWMPDAAADEAGRLYDLLLPSMASELSLDGNVIENQRYRSAIIFAVQQLVTAINKLELTVGKTEAELKADYNGIPFVGYADLLLRDPHGHPFVLDLKWTNSSRYRKTEVEEGSALQLAVYAWMLRSSEQVPNVHSGYFMLAQGQLISDSSLLAEEAVASQYTLEEIWNMGVSSLEYAVQQLSDGMIEARGVQEWLIQVDEVINSDKVEAKLKEETRKQGMLYQKPPCGFCDFACLCGLSGGAA